MYSSLLHVTNDAGNRPEQFSLKDIEVSVDREEQNWLKRAHVGKFLGLEDIRTSLNGLEKCEMLTRQWLVPSSRGAPVWHAGRHLLEGRARLLWP